MLQESPIVKLDQRIQQLGTGERGKEKYSFFLPMGLKVDKNKDLWVADSRNSRVICYDRTDYRYKYQIGSGERGMGNYQFKGSNDLVISKGMEVFVCDTHNDRIMIYDDQHKFKKQIGYEEGATALGQFNHPTGITLIKDKYIAVTGWTNCRVQLFTLSGEFVASFARKGTAGGELYGPKRIIYDAGKLYITDRHNNRVSYWTDDGEFIGHIGEGEIQCPWGLSKKDDLIFVADPLADDVKVFSEKEERSGRITSESLFKVGGQLDKPKDVLIDKDMCYIADTHNERILCINEIERFIDWS